MKQGHHCPYLGLKHNRAIRFASATPEHRCYVQVEPQEIPVDQTRYCLSANHVRCPLYTGEKLASIIDAPPPPVRGLRGWFGSLSRRDRLIYGGLLSLLAVIMVVYGIAFYLFWPSFAQTPGAGGEPGASATPSPPASDTPVLTATPATTPTPTRTPRPTPTRTPTPPPTQTPFIIVVTATPGFVPPPIIPPGDPPTRVVPTDAPTGAPLTPEPLTPEPLTPEPATPVPATPLPATPALPTEIIIPTLESPLNALPTSLVLTPRP